MNFSPHSTKTTQSQDRHTAPAASRSHVDVWPRRALLGKRRSTSRDRHVRGRRTTHDSITMHCDTLNDAQRSTNSRLLRFDVVGCQRPIASAHGVASSTVRHSRGACGVRHFTRRATRVDDRVSANVIDGSDQRRTHALLTTAYHDLRDAPAARQTHENQRIHPWHHAPSASPEALGSGALVRTSDCLAVPFSSGAVLQPGPAKRGPVRAGSLAPGGQGQKATKFHRDGNETGDFGE